MFEESFVSYDPKSKMFKEYLLTKTGFLRRILSIRFSTKECLLFYTVYAENVEVYCINFISIRIGHENNEIEFSQELKIDPVYQAVSISNDTTSIIVFLTKSMNLEIWGENEHGDLVYKHKLSSLSPQWITTQTFAGYNYLAIITHSENKKLTDGNIDIYKSDFTNLDEFNLYQKIPMKRLKQIEFSLLPTSELVLYVLTSEPGPTFHVYTYAGFAHFKNLLKSSSIKSGYQFWILKNYQYNTELIAIKTNDSTEIIEAIMEI